MENGFVHILGGWAIFQAFGREGWDCLVVLPCASDFHGQWIHGHVAQPRLPTGTSVCAQMKLRNRRITLNTRIIWKLTSLSSVLTPAPFAKTQPSPAV